MPVFSRFSRYIDEVVRRGSVRGAAETLNIASSAVDRQILTAEGELGVSLFERLPTGMRLTPAGEHFIHYLRRWRREYDDLLSELGNLKGTERGRLTLALTEAFTGRAMGDLLARFHREHPKVVVMAQVLAGRGVREMVMSGVADIGLTFLAASSRSIRVEHSVALPLGLAMRADHPMAKQASIPLRRCKALPIILPNPDYMMRRHFADAIDTEEVDVSPVAYADSNSLMCAMIHSGMGLGVTTKAHVYSECKTGEFAFVPLAGRKIAESRLSLVTPAHPWNGVYKLLPPIATMMDEMAAS